MSYILKELRIQEEKIWGKEGKEGCKREAGKNTFVESLRMKVTGGMQRARELRRQRKETQEVLPGGVNLIFLNVFFFFFERYQLKIEPCYYSWPFGLCFFENFSTQIES